MKGLRSILALSITLFALGACNKHDEPPAAESSSGGDESSSGGDESSSGGDNTIQNGDRYTGQKVNGSEDTAYRPAVD